MLEKWTLIWACSDPPGVLELPGFSQACPLPKGGKWDLGDSPRLGVERRAPIPTLGIERGLELLAPCRQPVLLLGTLCRESSGCLPPAPKSPFVGALPGVAEPAVPAEALRGTGLEVSGGFLGTEDRIHDGQREPGTERSVRTSQCLVSPPDL